MDLLNVKRLITHGNRCPDGLASAMIIKNAYKRQGIDVSVEFKTHQTPDFLEMEATPGLLFVDFSPPPKRQEEFLEAGTLVLDHHRGNDNKTKNMVLRFVERGLGVFSDEDDKPWLSGAVLAYQHIWIPLCGESSFLEDFSHIAGIRDTWQHKHTRWNEACEQAEALMFWPEDILLEAEPETEKWDDLLALGKIVWSRKQHTLQKVAEKSFRWVSAKGTKTVIFQGTKLSSDLAEYLETKQEDVDLIIAYDINHFPGETNPFKLGLSTRSHQGFNCRNFVGSFGGGGHTPAAGGAVTMDIEKDVNPYKMIQNLLNEYEANGSGKTQ